MYQHLHSRKFSGSELGLFDIDDVVVVVDDDDGT